MKKIGVILSILTVLTLSFITNNNVSAASDITYTLDSSNYSNQFVMCEASACSSYQYLNISYTGTINYSNGVPSKNVRLNFGSYTGQPTYISTFPSISTIKLDTSVNSLYYVVVQAGGSNLSSFLSDGGSITFTLSENNPAGGVTPEGTLDVVANGTYDVTNYASVDVQVEESSFIVQLFSQGFWGVATAIVTIIVPIIALFLIFRLVHDLLWGRG